MVSVRDNYLELLEQRHAATGRVVTVDGTQSRETLHKLVIAATTQLFRDKGFTTLFTK